MKILTKKVVVSLIASMFILSVILLAGCKNDVDRYLSVVPTHIDYKATLTYTNETSIGSHTKNWKVIRKSVSICGEEKVVIYIEYSYINNDNDYYNYDRTLMYVNGNVLRLNDNAWEHYTGSFGDKWSDIYGSYAQSGSFVYELTQNINGRDLQSQYKKVTDDYIEYDLVKDNEVFKISNDPYHLLLYYSFDYDTTHVRKTATFKCETPTDVIPYLSTITEEMIAEN